MTTQATHGIWLKHPQTGAVLYVVHEAHITRLLGEGGRVVPDPRLASAEDVSPPQVQVANEQDPQANVIDLTNERARPSKHVGRR